ncbi:hypothetical protein [Rossellomorea aquimaris]|uniref:Uncharacterized protein n=1 Tax=Rossellomorea aquimaris TaxID=189382 RepID=A0A1J6WIS1_9BACI|nr:hypothetical protein [Rossellomorea aquimaris]OIU71752.1 hypothetical protein BHE18_03585 [Rossellomorea aquimaris]
MILRKFLATLVSALICSLILAIFQTLDGNDPLYNYGNQLMSWSAIYFIYIGAIILIYGNIVSSAAEYVQKKLFADKDWLYILILGMFGVANGLVFNEILMAVSGMAAAVIYGVIEIWIARRMRSERSIKMFVIVPAAVYLFAWGIGQALSPPVPPFTKEDAVEFAVSGEGTSIDYFPEEIGVWEGNINGYKVKRETLVKETGRETYVIIFKEKWDSGIEKGQYSLSYKVKRGSSTINGQTGDTPPYY